MENQKIKDMLDTISDYVFKNFNSLKKSSFDGHEYVIVWVLDYEGDDPLYHHIFDGFGISVNGEYVRCGSVGCSCSGDIDIKLSSAENLMVNYPKIAEELALGAEKHGPKHIIDQARVFKYKSY